MHLYAFPPIKLIVVFIFFSTAIFNYAPEAYFYLFVSDLEWCNVLPFLAFYNPFKSFRLVAPILVSIRVLGVEHP